MKDNKLYARTKLEKGVKAEIGSEIVFSRDCSEILRNHKDGLDFTTNEKIDELDADIEDYLTDGEPNIEWDGLNHITPLRDIERKEELIRRHGAVEYLCRWISNVNYRPDLKKKMYTLLGKYSKSDEDKKKAFKMLKAGNEGIVLDGTNIKS